MQNPFSCQSDVYEGILQPLPVWKAIYFNMFHFLIDQIHFEKWCMGYLFVCDILILNKIFILDILIQLPPLHMHTHILV